MKRMSGSKAAKKKRVGQRREPALVVCIGYRVVGMRAGHIIEEACADEWITKSGVVVVISHGHQAGSGTEERGLVNFFAEKRAR